ncbi:MAG: hypothetical protein JW751_30580 [Polyangiaceae bacterium]|nr:hypothetical protein [Polyangiaceae bacterium]
MLVLDHPARCGARLEYGPVHLGFAGHFGEGLGLTRALEVSRASTDKSDHVRTFDGYCGQSQVVLGNFDLFAGAGIVRVFLADLCATRLLLHGDDRGRTAGRWSGKASKLVGVQVLN